MLILIGIYLGFMEPVWSLNTAWKIAEYGCKVEEVRMTFIQGVIGNTDVMGTVSMSYTYRNQNKNFTIIASLSRTMCTISDKKTESDFLIKAQKWKENNTIVDCYYDPLDPYRVSLSNTDNVDGFIWYVFIAFSLWFIYECYVVITGKIICDKYKDICCC
eukprot:246904_1